jgi:hypothetical protein
MLSIGPKSCRFKKIPDQGMAMLSGDAFRVILHPKNRFLFVRESHDKAIIRSGGYVQAGGETLFLCDQRVIACGGIGGGDSFKQARSIMRDARCFPMQRDGGADDFAAKGLCDGLMPEAYAQKGDGMFRRRNNKREANSRVIGVARAGGDKKPRRIFAQDIGNAALIVAIDLDRRAAIAQILDDIICKAIVIVDQGYHGFVMTFYVMKCKGNEELSHSVEDFNVA